MKLCLLPILLALTGCTIHVHEGYSASSGHSSTAFAKSCGGSCVRPPVATCSTGCGTVATYRPPPVVRYKRPPRRVSCANPADGRRAHIRSEPRVRPRGGGAVAVAVPQKPRDALRAER
jgi:hypothetical protein